MFAGLNLKQLEAFYWVAHLGSFSAAATRLNTTQPGISMRMRELEVRVGAPVFDHSRRASGGRLTPKGREMLRLVEQLVEVDRAWQDRLGGPAALTGIVRVGAADTMAMLLLPSLLAQVAERHPDIDVELFVDLSIHLQARLREGEIDVAFMVGDMGSPEYEVKPLGEVENAWMGSANLKLPRRRLQPADLAKLPVFTHSRGSHLHRMVLGWFEASGARPVRLHGCNSLAMMIKLTIAGLGVSVLPVPLLKEELAAGSIKRIAVDSPVPPNRFVVAYAATPAQAAVRAIVDLALGSARATAVFRTGGGRSQSART
ncbi:MAG: LysR family transcriptional regulator [Betaproteobacteria bacterium]|nr:LysR family transcriptional regulator [Betaproteobacteria bacterium]